MSKPDLHVVTGAFGFSGRYIAERLLAKGVRVRTLTSRTPPAGPLGDRVEVAPLSFSEPNVLTRSLRGADVVYNTYWIRFAHDKATHDLAVENTRILIQSAVDAGVRRFVHVSITNPSASSPLSYFHGKALLERALAESGLSYAILRPTVLFGPGDILINNIAWMLRRLPVFGIFGSGDYRIQPVHVDDLAEMAVQYASRDTNVTVDAVGPETFSYEQLVRRIRDAIAGRAWIIHVSPRLALAIARVMGRCMGDVVITREEVEGLMAGLLVSSTPPTCPTRFSDWLSANASTLGLHYASELSRHYRA